MEFVVAILKDEDGQYFLVNKIADWSSPDTPVNSGEAEYAVNRIAADLQTKRLVDELDRRSSTPETTHTASRIRKALKARREEQA